MSMQRVISGVLVLSCIFSANVSAADVPKKITCSGKVVDDGNRPVAGAKVTLYQLTPDVGGNELKNVTAEEQVTREDGGFSFSAETAGDKQYRFNMLVAAKEGYAIGWDNWLMREDKVMMLAMGKPYTLSGVVVDDAGKPVGGAEVRISVLLLGDLQGGPNGAKYIASAEPLDLLKTTTGDNGVFAFNGIPAEAKAEFAVKKAGRATISTFKPQQSLNNASYVPGQYTVQSKDIRIILPIEAKIEGKVVEKDTGKAVSGVKLICTGENPGGQFGVKPVVSKDDGTFSFDGLEAKTYTIRDVPSREKPAEWVIKPATVTTTAGQMSSGIILEASEGGMLEVTIRDNEKKPVAGASVSVRGKDSNQGASGVSNSEGIAAVRLAPGEYIVQGAYKQGYSSPPREQQTVTIEDGKTARLEIELKGVPKITGIVRDPNGRAVAG
ncbi:MAG: carboxypeptidase regulatory-like domain-containing protein, partial [Planctomycetota bacterium]|nr:carboxypeptidase regulatory-like domain-containing protein [Planctomycetota bacterium]